MRFSGNVPIVNPAVKENYLLSVSKLFHECRRSASQLVPEKAAERMLLNRCGASYRQRSCPLDYIARNICTNPALCPGVALRFCWTEHL